MACEGCFDKQIKIDKLEKRIVHLEYKLRRQELRNREGYFGSSAPSSKVPIKENSKKSSDKGGAKNGHEGHGRKSIGGDEADRIEHLTLGKERCPDCGGELKNKGIVERTVVEKVPVKVEKVLYECEKKWCPKCKKAIQMKPEVLPKPLYGNQLIASVATMHYVHGIPIGRIESILGNKINTGSLFDTLHRVGGIWKPAIEELIKDYKVSPVKHADETGWRNDGQSGYSWLFCDKKTSIFRFEDNRPGRVPAEIFGKGKLPGVLVVDRYGGYNKMPCKIQYCYAHLLRKVEDLGKQFGEEEGVTCFVGTFAPVLAEAMHLRNQSISDKEYYKKAAIIKQKILGIINFPARDPGIKEIQAIFKENEKRLYHWVTDRNVPAENNRAERELRPTVIARKVSFGSQSKKGAETRSILMAILHTAQKRLKNQTIEDWLKNALDKIVVNACIDPYSLLPVSG
ncbi:MAG: IS66 family transposase [bacterium]